MAGRQLKLLTPVGKAGKPAEYLWVEGERAPEAMEEVSVRFCRYLKRK